MVSKYKLFLTAAFAAVCVTGTVQAQVYPEDILKHSTTYFEAGAKAGVDFQQLSAYPFVATYTPGANAGIYVRRRMGSFGVVLEATASTAQYTTQYPVSHNFTLSHAKYEDTITKGVFNALYINLPLLLEIRPGNHFAFQFGAQYSYLLNLKGKDATFSKRYGTDEVLNKSNISMVTGFELDVYKDLKIGARYAIGLSDLNANKMPPLTDKWTVNSGQVFLVYSLDKWGFR